MWILITVLGLAPTAWAGDADAIRASLDLPRSAQALRDEGVTEIQLRIALDAANDAGISPGDFRIVLDGATRDARANGALDDFGLVVLAQVDAGKRGTELVDAIRDAHAPPADDAVSRPAPQPSGPMTRPGSDRPEDKPRTTPDKKGKTDQPSGGMTRPK